MVVHRLPLTGSHERDTWQRSWRTAGKGGGKKRAKPKENHESQLHLPEDQQSLSQPRDHPHPSLLPSSQWRSEGDPSHHSVYPVAKPFFPEADPAPPSPVLQTVCGYSSSLASFPNNLWCHRGMGFVFPAPHTIPTAQRRHSRDIVGAARALSSSFALAQDEGLGKAHGLAPECCRDITSGPMSCMVEACSSESSLKSQTLRLDNGNALEPIQFQALNSF